MVELGDQSSQSGWWDMWQATEKLGLSDRSVRRLINEGRIDGRKVAGRWWIKPVDHLPIEFTAEVHDVNEKKKRPELTSDRPARVERPPVTTGNEDTRENGHNGHGMDPLESLIDMRRLGGWRKTCELYRQLTVDNQRAIAKEAAAALVEGYLAFSSAKVQAYHRCRRLLCQLMVELQFEGCDPEIVRRCHEAIMAVQSLIIRFNKAKSSNGPKN